MAYVTPQKRITFLVDPPPLLACGAGFWNRVWRADQPDTTKSERNAGRRGSQVCTQVDENSTAPRAA